MTCSYPTGTHFQPLTLTLHRLLRRPLTSMFKKTLAHQSNATPLRSSARRQLVTAITGQHASLLSGCSADDAINEKEIGKLIVPEGVRSGTFETSGGVEGASVDLLW